MLILVCGVKSEPPVSLLIEALERQGADFLVLNQQDLAESVKIRWKLTNDGISGNLQVGSDVIDTREITGVFQRFMNVARMPIAEQYPEVIGKTRSILSTLVDLFDILPARIINRRRAMMSNGSKPFQSLLIRQAGFSIPETLITNNPGAAEIFINGHQAVIYKSISAIRSIVKTVDEDDIHRLEHTRLLPTQFQNKIKGVNVRVHVVGEKTFAARIKTDATDYRYAHHDETVELEPYKLTEALEKMCVSLAKRLDILFAGIDLMITNRELYCLEVNTSPAYSFYEHYTGQPISESLAELLSKSESPPS